MTTPRIPEPSAPQPRTLEPRSPSTSPLQHKDPLSGRGVVPSVRPEPGPIAVLPNPSALFSAAVVEGGGEVAPLSDATRGLVWLSERRADELAVVLRENPNIGWVQLPWAGVDGFSDLLASFADGSGPLITSAKGAYSEPVAEHAIVLAQAALRELGVKARDARWQPERSGFSLYGRRVVIVGAGGIAAEIIRLLEPYRTPITVVRRSPGDVAGADTTVTVDALAEVLPSAEVLILAAASTTESRHLIGAAELDLLPDGAALVNIARGALIDHDALLAAVRSGSLIGVGLDVTDPEPLPDEHGLWNEPRCIITSHSADTPEMTAPLLARRISENVRGFLGNGAFLGIVDPAAGY